MTFKPKWTDEAAAEAKRLWIEEGFSAGQIAQSLGGISRNAVIGKLTRMGVMGDKKRISRVRLSPVQKLKPKPLPVPPSPTVSLAPLGESNVFLTGSVCKYIHGDPQIDGWRMCGYPVARAGAAWCAFHDRLCHSKTAAGDPAVQADEQAAA